MNKILKKQDIALKIKRMEIEAPQIANKAKAGQFVIIRINEYGERIPLTIVETTADGIVIIFQEVGKTTIELGKMNIGDEILNLVGPLGNPTPIKKWGKVICIGGGVGIAELYPVIKAMKSAGNNIQSILGARSKDLIILEKEISPFVQKIHITTDDGSYGRKGLVTDILEDLLKKEEFNFCFAVGPVVMMSAVSQLTEKYNLETWVSLNPVMIDGTGMCGSCRVEIGGKTKFVCVDGPDFKANEVNFNQLLLRQKIYLEEEKRAQSFDSQDEKTAS